MTHQLTMRISGKVKTSNMHHDPSTAEFGKAEASLTGAPELYKALLNSENCEGWAWRSCGDQNETPTLIGSISLTCMTLHVELTNQMRLRKVYSKPQNNINSPSPSSIKWCISIDLCLPQSELHVFQKRSRDLES